MPSDTAPGSQWRVGSPERELGADKHGPPDPHRSRARDGVAEPDPLRRELVKVVVQDQRPEKVASTLRSMESDPSPRSPSEPEASAKI